MKIFHINSYYNGGEFYRNLYDNQIKIGLDIDVFVPVPTNYEDDGFDFGSYTKVSKNHNKFDRYIFHLKHYKIYKDVKKQYSLGGFSIIHAHSLFSNGYIAMKLKKLYGIPYIVAVRNTDVNFFFKKMIHLRKLGIDILVEAQKIVFLSKPYRDMVIDKYVPERLREIIGRKTSIIPNGIDEFWFENTRTIKKEINRSNLSLLQIGDIDRNKNIETTVKAVDRLIDKGYTVKLDVVGKIKDQKVYNTIKNLEYINYLGYRSKEELLSIYRNNDIFVLPSIHETFGLVYAEAMSQGLPIIYSKGQGFDEQFEDGEVGYSVDCDSPEDICRKIIRITNNYVTKSTSCLINSNRFNWKAISDEYLEIYRNIYLK